MTLKKRRGVGSLINSQFAMTKIFCFLVCILIASAEIKDNPHEKQDCTDLERDEATLMVFSTLGGGLTAIDPISSEIRWTIADDPPVKAEQDQQDMHVPQYLPDPRDGSIYQLSGEMGSLKKLPYTIPQLVANAPCRSSDGILYSGKKSDTWFIVDPKTGKREKLMGFGSGTADTNEHGEKIGWATSRAIYLGRTQYTVMMYDSLAKGKNIKPWNITFYDYSAQTITPDITKEYEYIHLTTTTTGNLVTLNRQNGKFLWQHDLSSPVVSAFLLGNEGLLSVPFTTVSDEAFEAILEESKIGNVNTIKLFQSLYVGEHQHGLYALPSLVDKNTPQISTSPAIKLIDGPMASQSEKAETDETNQVYINEVLQSNIGIVLGHYNMPEADGKLQIRPPTGKAPTGSETATDLAAVSNFPLSFTMLTETTTNVGVQTDPMVTAVPLDSPNSGPTDALNSTKKLILVNGGRIQAFISKWFMEHPSGKVHQILIVMTLVIAAMFWYIFSSMRELKQQSEHGSKTSVNNNNNNSSSTSAHSSVSSAAPSSNTVHEELVDVGDGHVRVGKIVFNPQHVLGKGCEGTFVFRGTFEGRFVAVKRLLPECFTFADREVSLLRESDAHENVVRYFCTEQDRQFRYIAVELCAATLQDYTEGELSFALRNQIDVWEVLRQSASGLSHLHTLHIVHRDIKPQNVLLSLPDARGCVRVMISDFGLCKKLNFGKMSFSRRSGITGTDGWIAPEMLHGQRTTTAVDIFSLGCVYYYVLSDGQHAFGDALKRQANILQHDYNLARLQVATDNGLKQSKFILAEQLIADMIHKNPQKRPPARCLGEHPLFWSERKLLAFLQDVSDRVEKLQFNVEPLRSLEKNGRVVVHGDWNLHLDPLITDDLRKYRGYMGASVRDLLRALRNKKHHYHELPEEVQQLLGAIPYEFTKYWIRKFPMLISHTYHAFSICANESMFKPYYNAEFIFTLPEYFDSAEDPHLEILRDPRPLAKPSSPKKPFVAQQGKQRKGLYNFRKLPQIPNAEEPVGTGSGGNTADLGVGLLRNVEVDDEGERNVFANFKFRRYAKTANQRNYNKTANTKNYENP